MKQDGWYNGYSWKARNKKFDELKRRIADGRQRAPEGPCDLCGDPGDPEVTFEYHDEDYSDPYLWEPPVMYCLCQSCHRHRLHQRFRYPAAWAAFLTHVRRGGYAREMNDPECKREVAAYRKSLAKGHTSLLRPLRPCSGVSGQEWFARLSLDRATMTAATARPRP